MELLRITAAEARAAFRLVLTLTDGTVIERDVDEVLNGPILEPLRSDPDLFRRVRVDGGTVASPNGADLCPDVVIWGGRPPASEQRPAAIARVSLPPGDQPWTSGPRSTTTFTHSCSSPSRRMTRTRNDVDRKRAILAAMMTYGRARLAGEAAELQVERSYNGKPASAPSWMIAMVEKVTQDLIRDGWDQASERIVPSRFVSKQYVVGDVCPTGRVIATRAVGHTSLMRLMRPELLRLGQSGTRPLCAPEIKTHTLEREEALRSKTPSPIRQEVWGLALGYNLVRLAMARVAETAGVPPTRVRVRHALQFIRLFWLTAWSVRPGVLPRRLDALGDELALLILPPRRSHRRYPRAVKIKMSGYPTKPPRQQRKPLK